MDLTNIEFELSSPAKPSDKANYDEPTRANVLNSIFNVIEKFQNSYQCVLTFSFQIPIQTLKAVAELLQALALITPSRNV